VTKQEAQLMTDNFGDAATFFTKGNDDELNKEIEAVYEKTIERFSAATTDGERRGVMRDNLKEMMRACFMSHHAATAEDFERFWPGIFEHFMREYTLETFMHIIDERDNKQTSEE
jgi:hypothetical protein